MSNRLKIIIAAAGIGLNIIVLLIVVLLKSKNSAVAPSTPVIANDLPAVYTASVNQQNKDYTAEITVNNKTGIINEPDLSRYILVSFNSPVDVMWVSCASGHVITNPKSLTNNKIGTDPDVGVNIELQPNRKNNLTLTCAKQ